MNHKYGVAYQSDKFIGFRDEWFTTYNELKKFSTDGDDLHNYEIIIGNQSLYFDFDGREKISDEIFNRLSSVIKSKFKQNIIILLFNSIGFDKYSYHVVVKGVYFSNHITCGSMAKEIIKDVGDLDSSFDSSVYTSRRNFRMLGSRKINSTRVKVFDRILFKDDDFKISYQDDIFRMSLITEICGELITMGCFEIKNAPININLWTEDDIKEVEEFVSGNFTNAGIVNGILNLKRNRPSECVVCGRVHSSENAFATKNGDKLFFFCRRNIEKKHPIRQDDWHIVLKVVDDEKVENSQQTESSKDKILKIINNYYSFE